MIAGMARLAPNSATSVCLTAPGWPAARRVVERGGRHRGGAAIPGRSRGVAEEAARGTKGE
eukprot:6746505-Prymnesium_polylepis.3